jgi:DNA-directed RNA polymerase subunit RPC12/RpoP
VMVEQLKAGNRKYLGAVCPNCRGLARLLTMPQQPKDPMTLDCSRCGTNRLVRLKENQTWQAHK